MNQEKIQSRFQSTSTSTPYKGIMDCFVKVKSFAFLFININYCFYLSRPLEMKDFLHYIKVSFLLGFD